MNDIRKERLTHDYQEMLRIQDLPYLSWIATKGEIPYVEEYLLDIHVRSYALSVTNHLHSVGIIDRCIVKVTLWDSYPNVAPNIKILNIPPVFHPNWYSRGTYSPIKPWHRDDSLKDYIKQMIGTLQYRPSLIETNSPANYKALDWYMKNRGDDRLFPSDHTELTENGPDETAILEKAGYSFVETVDCWGQQ